MDVPSVRWADTEPERHFMLLCMYVREDRPGSGKREEEREKGGETKETGRVAGGHVEGEEKLRRQTCSM